MVKRLFAAAVCLTSVSFSADAVMSEAYWKIWNPEVQAKIDADIEAHRKADAAWTLQVKDGTEVKVEQVSHAFIFGAHIFNFNQLGKARVAWLARGNKGGDNTHDLCTRLNGTIGTQAHQADNAAAIDHA